MLAQRAEPYILYAPDGKFYFTASVPAYDRIVLRCPNTLQGLADAGEVTVWVRHETGIMNKHIWAPELHYLRGKWYSYNVDGEKDDAWTIRPYVHMCEGHDLMRDLWVECGMLRRADAFCFNDFSLDMTVFEHKDRMYTIWAEKVNQGKKIGPGHNTFFTDEDGKLVMAYHARPYDEIIGDPLYDANRHAYLMDIPVEDGRPVFCYSNNRINP